MEKFNATKMMQSCYIYVDVTLIVTGFVGIIYYVFGYEMILFWIQCYEMWIMVVFVYVCTMLISVVCFRLEV